jgi:NAD(P)-dependent dehydrogenase (short-subunit alcohol dehydrogenase family)
LKDLNGKIAAITGAGSGIGKATAILLAREGCGCAIADIDEAGLRRTEDEIRALGAAIHATVLDVSDREAVYEWADEVARHFGKVNLVINNAGVSMGVDIEDMSYEDLEWLLGINFYGMVYGTKAFLPFLKQTEEGHLVNLSSVFGLIATPTQSAYTCAKFAIKGFTECLRLELEADGCNVSCTVVHPGGVKTHIARDGRISESLMQRHGLSREEMADNFERTARTTPERAAELIVQGIKKNKHRVLVGPDAHVIDMVQRLMPTVYLRLMSLNYRLMQKMLQRRAK